MVEVPENQFTQADLAEWYKLADNLRTIKNREMLLRRKIFGCAFPNPTEGTNSYDLTDGYVLKGKHSIQRDIDIGAFDSLKEKLRENKINPDSLVKYKPDLVLSAYRKLTEEEQHLFDQCLIVKPGSPALEIVLPKKKGKA